MIEWGAAAMAVAAGAVLATAGLIGRVWRAPARLWPVAVGAVLIAVAAGRPAVRWTAAVEYVVLVDASASMRGVTAVGTPIADPARWREAARGHGAVVFVTDGRFDGGLPRPTDPVVWAMPDPALDDPDDAAVVRLRRHGDFVEAVVRAGRMPRTLRWSGGRVDDVPGGGGERIYAMVVGREERVSVALTPGDAWPENDALAMEAEAPSRGRRVWIGDGAPAGWSVGSWPPDGDVSAVVVRDGDSAGVGEWAKRTGGVGILWGRPVDPASPLSALPPGRPRRWRVLLDASGSMGQAGKAESARRAAEALLAAIPPDDAVSVGTFAADVRWWFEDAKAGATPTLPTIEPRGPTNLEAALRALSASPDSIAVVLTDGEAEIGDPVGLAARLAASRVRVVVVCGQWLAGDHPVRRIGARVTDGVDPARWVRELRDAALAGAAGEGAGGEQLVRHAGVLAGVADVRATLVAPVWAKADAEVIARGESAVGAQWRAGIGRVAAFAYRPTAAEVDALADLAEPAREQGFGLDIGARITAWGDRPGALSLDGAATPLRAVVPGRWEASVAVPRQGATVVVTVGDRVVLRRAVAGRYDAEFDAIGNDREALRRLAEATGGAVLALGQRPPGVTRRLELTPWLAGGGVLMVLWGLVRLRRGQLVPDGAVGR